MNENNAQCGCLFHQTANSPIQVNTLYLMHSFLFRLDLYLMPSFCLMINAGRRRPFQKRGSGVSLACRRISATCCSALNASACLIWDISFAWKAFSLRISRRWRTLAHSNFILRRSFFSLCFFILRRRMTMRRAASILSDLLLSSGGAITSPTRSLCRMSLISFSQVERGLSIMRLIGRGRSPTGGLAQSSIFACT